MIVAIDQGTSSTKALLVDDDGAIVARASAPIGCSYPRPGWVEQDAEEIWQSVLAAIAALPDTRRTRSRSPTSASPRSSGTAGRAPPPAR